MSDITVCVNSESMDVSVWDVAFVRIWRVKGTYYGFNALGIYELSGPSDDGTQIGCRIVTSPNDLGTEALKRIPYARAEARGVTSAELRLDGVFCGLSEMVTVDKRAKFGRGGSGRFISFSVTSTDPAFTLIEIAPVVEVLKRGYK